MTTHRHISLRHIVLGCVAALGPAWLLTGCSSITGNGLGTTKPAQAIATGSVHGGQQPVAGATIQLYAVNTTAMQGASASLLTSAVASDQNGFFTITNLYSCPAPDALVYIVATGGNPGAGNNPALALMAALGRCGDLKPTTFISVNELTTVASVYALAPFMADIEHVGAPTANLAGIMRAFQSVNSLVNTANGYAPGTGLPGNGTAPVAELNTLADIIASCINSTGSGGPCATLFAAAHSPAGGVPTDTIAATLNIALSPGNSVAALFTLVTSNGPFQPVLPVVPQDWSIAIRYTGGGITAPHGIALDVSGNVWIANEGAFSVTELSPTGLPLSGANGYTGGGLLAPQGIAVDLSGNVWVANAGGNSVVKLNNSGTPLSGAGGFTTGIYGPVDIAVDASGNAWVANFLDNSVTKLDPSGNVIAGPLSGSNSISLPTSIALGPTGDVWVSSSGTGTLVRFNSTGSLLSPTGSTDQYLQGPAQVALNSSGQAFVAAPGSNSVSAFDSTGTALPASPFYNAGLNNPTATVTDGSGSLWLANNVGAGSLSHLTVMGTPLSPSTGLGAVAAPAGLAVDASGSIWTANSGDDSVSQFIGIAGPVSLPLASRNH